MATSKNLSRLYFLDTAWKCLLEWASFIMKQRSLAHYLTSVSLKEVYMARKLDQGLAFSMIFLLTNIAEQASRDGDHLFMDTSIKLNSSMYLDIWKTLLSHSDILE